VPPSEDDGFRLRDQPRDQPRGTAPAERSRRPGVDRDCEALRPASKPSSSRVCRVVTVVLVRIHARPKIARWV
jgi:hypothetical protein